MALLPNGQSCLEHIGLVHRPVLIQKNEYNKEEEYNVTHPNAIADGDGRGRGTLSGGHTHSIPDCKTAEYIGEHYTSAIIPQLDSSLCGEREAGDCVDIHGRPGLDHSGREALLRINGFGPECKGYTEYGKNSVNTAKNVEDDQYVFEYWQKTKIKCNNS